MIARDLMSKTLVTVSPDHSVRHAARILLEHQVSGAPVVDDEANLAGIITEGDLLRRVELGTEDGYRSDSLTDLDLAARAYVKARSWKVGDVMTTALVTIAEDTSMRAIAELMGRHGVKRLPVMREGRIVGIVSRRELLNVIATWAPSNNLRTDEALRTSLMVRLADASPVLSHRPDVHVEDGMITLAGTLRSQEEFDAVRMIVEEVAGSNFNSRLTIVGTSA